jgi:hypothetical protein
MPEERPAASFPADYIRLFRESLAFLLNALRRSWLSVSLIMLLCLAAGFTWWYSRPAYFDSEVVCQYVNQPFGKKVFGEMTQKLDALARSHSSNELAKQLQIRPEQAAQIIGIEGKNRSGSALYEDITEEYQPLYFVVRARDRSVFGPVEAGLLRYLGNTPYEQRMSLVQQQHVAGRLVELRADLARIDSIMAAFTIALRNGTVFIDTSASQFVSAKAMLEYRNNLEERIANLERQRGLDSGEVVKVMHHFMPADRAQRGSKKVIAAFGLAGLLLAMVVALVRRNPEADA